jgi:hypothetical protein
MSMAKKKSKQREPEFEDYKQPSPLAIDRDSLDEEWVNQPDLYHTHAVNLADARKALDEEKIELDVVKAELDKEIRESPADFGLEKTTETSIALTIVTQKRYKQQQQKVIDAKHHVDVLAAMVTALDHRKRALENLVDLHGQSYFASPRTTGEKGEAMREAEKRSVRRRGQEEDE